MVDLATGLRDGDRDALAEVFRRWSALVHTVALRALAAHADAEDVTQQVFLSAWHSRHTLTPTEHALPAWLLGITRHRIADRFAERAREARTVGAVTTGTPAARDPARRAPGEPEPRPRPEPAPDEVGAIVDRLVLAQGLEELGEPRSTILRMAFHEDLTQEEIAARTRMPLGTVKSHVRRGLLQLRRTLEEVRGELA